MNNSQFGQQTLRALLIVAVVLNAIITLMHHIIYGPLSIIAVVMFIIAGLLPYFLMYIIAVNVKYPLVGIVPIVLALVVDVIACYLAFVVQPGKEILLFYVASIIQMAIAPVGMVLGWATHQFLKERKHSNKSLQPTAEGGG